MHRTTHDVTRSLSEVERAERTRVEPHELREVMNADAEGAVVGRIGKQGDVRNESRQRGGRDGERKLGCGAYSRVRHSIRDIWERAHV